MSSRRKSLLDSTRNSNFLRKSFGCPQTDNVTISREDYIAVLRKERADWQLAKKTKPKKLSDIVLTRQDVNGNQLDRFLDSRPKYSEIMENARRYIQFLAYHNKLAAEVKCSAILENDKIDKEVDDSVTRILSEENEMCTKCDNEFCTKEIHGLVDATDYYNALITDLDGISLEEHSMAATFDPFDKSCWYFGPMKRQDATDLLMGEKEGGVFLIRDSTTIIGDYVLCVREDSKVSHYIINKIQQGEQVRYRIGDQMFTDLPSLLAFYKLHYLDTTPLIKPAPKRVEKVLAKYDFDGNDSEDLPFKKGEILQIVSKDEEQWWTARNSAGKVGSIPVPYVHKYEENQQFASDGLRPNSGGNSLPQPTEPPRRANIQRKLPAMARVKQARVPNAYDKTALKLEVGDVIMVTKMNINGQWDGELKGRSGHFPFTHVEFVDNENNDTENS